MADDAGQQFDGFDAPDGDPFVDDDRWAPVGSSNALEDMRRTLATFGTRLDSLVTSTTSYRSAVTDRLVEYADMVNTLVRNQSEDLAAAQTTNDRVLQDLRRGLGETGDSVSVAVARLETLLADDPRQDVREVVAEVRGLVDAHDRLGRFIVDALDQFGDRVNNRLDETNAQWATQLAGLRDTVVEMDARNDASAASVDEVAATIAQMRNALVDVASGEVVGALWDEVRVLRDGIEADRDAERTQVSALVDEIAAIHDGLTAGLEVAVDGNLAAVVAQLQRLLDGELSFELPAEFAQSVTAIEHRLELLAGSAADAVPAVIGVDGNDIDLGAVPVPRERGIGHHGRVSCNRPLPQRDDLCHARFLGDALCYACGRLERQAHRAAIDVIRLQYFLYRIGIRRAHVAQRRDAFGAGRNRFDHTVHFVLAMFPAPEGSLWVRP
mgnify:CR=1 FL=1